MIFKIPHNAMQQRSGHQHKASIRLRALRPCVGGRAALLLLAQRFRPERDMIHQQREQALVLAGKAHALGPVGEFGRQPERRAQRKAGQQIRHAADRVEPFLPHAQPQRHTPVRVQPQRGRKTDRFAARHGASQHAQHLFAQAQFAFLPESPQPSIPVRSQRGGRHMAAGFLILAAGALRGAGGQQAYPLRRRGAHVIAQRIRPAGGGMHASPAKQFFALPVTFAVRPHILPKNHLPPSMQSLVC